jgi:hypothetical protein
MMVGYACFKKVKRAGREKRWSGSEAPIKGTLPAWGREQRAKYGNFKILAKDLAVYAGAAWASEPP